MLSLRLLFLRQRVILFKQLHHIVPVRHVFAYHEGGVTCILDDLVVDYRITDLINSPIGINDVSGGITVTLEHCYGHVADVLNRDFTSMSGLWIVIRVDLESIFSDHLTVVLHGLN